MDFPLQYVPTTADEMAALKAAVERFEANQKEQEVQP
jgi:hypothetical protein